MIIRERERDDEEDGSILNQGHLIFGKDGFNHANDYQYPRAFDIRKDGTIHVYSIISR